MKLIDLTEDSLRSWLTERGQTFLGRVIDTIPLSPEALASNDPEEVIFSNLDFVDWAQQKAYLLVGEFPIESLMVGSTDYYLGEILNGGHGQFIWNSGWNELTNILVDAGLTAFGRDGYLEIYREMVETVKADSLLLSNIVERKIEFGAACEHFSKLDDRFYALGCEWASGTNGEYQSYDHLRFLMANWLRALPIVRPVPDEQREALLEDWKKRNLLLDARSEKDREATKAQRAADPTYRPIMALCEKAGLEFVGLTAGGRGKLRDLHPSLPNADGIRWGVMTSAGLVFAVFYRDKGLFKSRNLGVLVSKETRSLLATIEMSSEQLAAVAG